MSKVPVQRIAEISTALLTPVEGKTLWPAPTDTFSDISHICQTQRLDALHQRNTIKEASNDTTPCKQERGFGMHTVDIHPNRLQSDVDIDIQPRPKQRINELLLLALFEKLVFPDKNWGSGETTMNRLPIDDLGSSSE
jgi:hypothetical protein